LGQPVDFYADRAAFSNALNQDLIDKARLLKVLGDVKIASWPVAEVT
jgi:hypothetical protein